MAKFGGKQPGAGRPKGSIKKPRFSDYISEDQVKILVAKAMMMASEGDPHMLKFCLDQHFGKAVQPIGNDGDNAFKISGVEITVKANEQAPS